MPKIRAPLWDRVILRACLPTALAAFLSVPGPVTAAPAAVTSGPRPDIVVSEFEGAAYADGWTTTGNAFGHGPAHGTLPDQMTVSGYDGKGLVNSFLGGDSATGTLTSPPFVLQRRYLRFLIGGGFRADQESLSLLLDGKTVRTATGDASEQLEPRQWDVSALQGRSVQLRVTDTGVGGWGHILVDDVVQSDQPQKPPADPITRAMAAVRAAIPQASADPNRPVYHFHAPAQWMNDTNGFLFFRGWYHVFYQFNPYGSVWGDIHWGHARSRDLVNWQQLPVALWPSRDRGEQHVFSGSLFPDAAGLPMAFYTSVARDSAPRDPEVWAATPLART